MKYIKIGIRYNLITIMMLVISTGLRKIVQILMDKIIGIISSCVFTLTMFLGMLVFGLVVHFYFKFTIYDDGKKDRDPDSESSRIELIYHKTSFVSGSRVQIYFLIFAGTFFDFQSFLSATYFLPKFPVNPVSLDTRTRAIIIICSVILWKYNLNYKIERHHILSVIIISVCFVLVLLSDFIFLDYVKDNKIVDYIKYLLSTLYSQILLAFHYSLHKYLMDINHIDPINLVYVEGFLGALETTLLIFIKGEGPELAKMSEINYFPLMIIFLILYFIFSGGRNIYVFRTIQLYSPATVALSDSLLDPLYLIYFYINSKEENVTHFVLNLIFSIIIVFCSCVYNELIVLSFWKLDYYTHLKISHRASEIGEKFEMNIVQDIVS